MDAIAEKQSVDRLGQKTTEPDIAQGHGRRSARPYTVIFTAYDDVAFLHHVDPTGPVRLEDVTGLLSFRQIERWSRHHEVGVDVVAEFPYSPRDHRFPPAMNSPGWVITPAIADAATVAGDAM